ncbi:MAG: bifunctional adenosylcobinamide kinase/adenosylcobinamide-phosphate guanylyltransferase [Chloroflexota bacterium]|nr:bifunctional adenosylcobinamide kinase/adenosylcobinamide-phosphate guanylyltransferase [Chloroflexota bacterium]
MNRIEVSVLSNKVVFILGGARSGKSSYAQEMANSISGKVLFVGTAEPLNEDMRTRIEKHQQERPASWRTLEASTNIAVEIARHIGDARVVLIDCLTLLTSNLVLGEERGFAGSEEVDEKAAENRVITEIEALIEFMNKSDATFIIVSNEVGLGLVPEIQLGRIYRDILGRANQLMARHASEVNFLVAGIPVKVKG